MQIRCGQPLPKALRQFQVRRSLLALALDWLLIVLCFGLVSYWPSVWLYGLAMILVARTQLALAVLMHDSAHRLLCTSGRWNDWLGQILTAAPLMLSLWDYRHGHLQHHRAPMAADDPVALVFGIADYPVSRKQLVWRLAQDLCGLGYLRSVVKQLRAKARQPRRSKATAQQRVLVISSIVVVQLVLILLLRALGQVQLYGWLWLLPAVTWLPFFARIRAITEHAGYPACSDQRHNARTVIKPNWQTFFVGPHAIHYHIEHHQYPQVPFYHLPQVHQWMRAQGQLPEANLYRSYGQVLKDVSF